MKLGYYLFRVVINPFKITLIVRKKFEESIRVEKSRKNMITLYFFEGSGFNQKATKKNEILNLKK